jgi:hypothetical protein
MAPSSAEAEMRVLDLFSGLGGWAEPFRDAGHDVTTLDVDPRFECDVTADVMTWEPTKSYDVITASPPCERFSTLTFQRGYFALAADGRAVPVTDEAREAIALVVRTIELIELISPRWFVIENPRALLRSTGVIPFERRTAWYCHLGSAVAKPTDLWGGFPPSLRLPAPCHNRRPGHEPGCCCHDHNPAPRGSRTGTQGPDDAATRAKVPYALGSVFEAAVTTTPCLSSMNLAEPQRPSHPLQPSQMPSDLHE